MSVDYERIYIRFKGRVLGPMTQETQKQKLWIVLQNLAPNNGMQTSME